MSRLLSATRMPTSWLRRVTMASSNSCSGVGSRCSKRSRFSLRYRVRIRLSPPPAPVPLWLTAGRQLPGASSHLVRPPRSSGPPHRFPACLSSPILASTRFARLTSCTANQQLFGLATNGQPSTPSALPGAPTPEGLRSVDNRPNSFPETFENEKYKGRETVPNALLHLWHASVVLHAILHLNQRLFGHGCVANPCETYGYRCGLRLALIKNLSAFNVPSTMQHHTSQSN